MNKDKRRLGDRYDGRRLRRTPAFFTVMPHIMKRRSDSIVLFDEVIDIENLEKYVRRKRKEDNLPGFSTYHLFIAAAVRMITLRPWLNPVSYTHLASIISKMRWAEFMLPDHH